MDMSSAERIPVVIISSFTSKWVGMGGPSSGLDSHSECWPEKAHQDHGSQETAQTTVLGDEFGIPN
jgi:hypothetical protein